ncbi:hypothetical protein FHS29_000959 [Saccharothrix tamanrassetensis]|uniref:Tn3 transposase DDE domain-containing protein n=1 Tax=Saccharothrix tamanrassetensis TaxID=1051531 RepID=A0A841CAF9_9PSEU|nr:hypothetical protein [Saccharothrix tamanrassetensis]
MTLLRRLGDNSRKNRLYRARFGGELIGRNDPDYQQKIIKCNELLANCVIYSDSWCRCAVPRRRQHDGLAIG